MSTKQHAAVPKVRVIGGFWKQKTSMVAQEMVPYQWKALNDKIPGAEPSHAIENFRIAAGEAEGEFVGTIFQDSDLAKWIEAACYVLADKGNAELDAQVEEAIRLVGKVQSPDGYINTWFTLVGPDKRWTDLAWGHELYCGGHLIEAAVTHFQVTGQRNFLDIMIRFAEHLMTTFGPGGRLADAVGGHPEIELALNRLAEATGDERYAQLATHFVDIRGLHPENFTGQIPLGFEIPKSAWFEPDYFLAHAPVREQHHAEGHAVRAMYLYTAMAQQAKRTGEQKLIQTLETLWKSTTERRQYVTGGLGSHAMGERFSVDFDLPSDTAYTETCASIGFLFWARAMLDLNPKGEYADAMEITLYNGVLSGVALDGKKFFYVNPLEVIPRIAHKRSDLAHVKTERVAWFGCACCPPNIARLVASVGNYAWSIDQNVRIDQYIESEASFCLGSSPLTMRMKTSYPWQGKVSLSVDAGNGTFEVKLRVPGWCQQYSVKFNGTTISPPLEGGYLRIYQDWKSGDVVELDLDMPVRFVSAHPSVSELAGKVAVLRGPLVYCTEEIDNGPDLHTLNINPLGPTSDHDFIDFQDEKTKLTVSGSKHRTRDGQSLYQEWSTREAYTPIEITMVPYHSWGNRRPGQEMRVWHLAEYPQ